MTLRPVRWFLSFRIWCQLCNAEFGSEVELAGHISSAHPRGR